MIFLLKRSKQNVLDNIQDLKTLLHLKYLWHLKYFVLNYY